MKFQVDKKCHSSELVVQMLFLNAEAKEFLETVIRFTTTSVTSTW